MGPPGAREFPTTSWSLIRKAADLDAPGSRDALASLCQFYWHPLYAFLRRSGRSREDAEDLVQGFFTQLLNANRLEHLTPERGTFRGFLLVALKNFVSTAHASRIAAKRGGGLPHLPFTLDLEMADAVYQGETGATRTPEESYERRWALTLLSNVLHRLGKDRAAAGEGALFAALEGFLPGGLARESYAEVAARLDTSPGAVKVAVHRMRLRYRELLREEITSLLGDPAGVDDEIRYLHSVLSR